MGKKLETIQIKQDRASKVAQLLGKIGAAAQEGKVNEALVEASNLEKFIKKIKKYISLEEAQKLLKSIGALHEALIRAGTNQRITANVAPSYHILSDLITSLEKKNAPGLIGQTEFSPGYRRVRGVSFTVLEVAVFQQIFYARRKEIDRVLGLGLLTEDSPAHKFPVLTDIAAGGDRRSQIAAYWRQMELAEGTIQPALEAELKTATGGRANGGMIITTNRRQPDGRFLVTTEGIGKRRVGGDVEVRLNPEQIVLSVRVSIGDLVRIIDHFNDQMGEPRLA